MKKKEVFLIGLVVFILATAFSVRLLFSSDKILVNFEILNVTNHYSDYVVEFSEVKAADHYVIQVHDASNRKVYEKTTNKLTDTLSLTNLINNEEYSIMVFAYDELGDYRPCEKEYKFVWDEPTFNSELSLMLNDEDYKLMIDGNLGNKEYYLNIKDGEQTIVNEIIRENEYIISKDYFIGQEKELIVTLVNNDAIIDELHLFNNMNPVSDVSISSITNEQVIPYNDVTLSYTGGENANQIEIKIYKDNKCIKTSSTSRKSVILSKNLFEVANNYRVDVIAKYGDYFKEASVNFIMSDQIQLSPVYISNNWKYIKKGTKLELMSRDEEAKIYYTLDGKNPESFGHLYTEPIEINENVTLKTVAVLEGKLNSIVSTYDINVGVKEKLSVYLSPSNQHGNLGVSEVGFTNEMDEMNDVTNYIEERLKSYGVKVYRNNPAGNINQWNKDSNYYGVDFKLAIHSNASNEHDTYGIETWVDTENSATLSIAESIQNGLMSIYPYADLENVNRGVKYANGALGEANDNYIPFGILVEIAHHDYADDAEWIMENKKLIGYNIADSILKYYQIID